MKRPVFIETLRIEEGVIYNLNLHRERVHETAFLHYGTKPEIDINTSLIPSHLKGKRVKCRILYDEDIISVEFFAYEFKTIRSLQVIEDNSITYCYKSVVRDALQNLLMQKKTADDIIITKNGNITDSSFSNLVFESSDGALFTPETYLLGGTKRKFLLKNGIIREKKITIDDLSLYQKVYLINALIDIEDNISVPVSSIIL
ncbi:MAG: aminotransferase class IV [Proteiniphilum sp.]|nr:aminotransferase class IV [Proteiniphilum sp.]MDD3908582.1 aminotransferase class IV [Proteiniphilum sp.]MDD4415324.1 aminotransferase class IV [Proteiniphilum sp.]